MSHLVVITDNFSAPDPMAPAQTMSFDDVDAAVQFCCRLVDRFLAEVWTSQARAGELWDQFVNFGECPTIKGPPGMPLRFDGWSYARRRCEQLTGELIPKRTEKRHAGYVIDCDYGGAWGWIFRPERKAFIGSICASCDRWSGQIPISRRLVNDFCRWQRRFELAPLSRMRPGQKRVATFSWPAFHKDGLALAGRLKTELGPLFRVIYSRPWEDESGLMPMNLEIHPDGTAQELQKEPAAGE